MLDPPAKHRKAQPSPQAGRHPSFSEGGESLQGEGFDRILGGDDPDYGHVAGAPQMGTSPVEHTRRLATVQGVRQG